MLIKLLGIFKKLSSNPFRVYVPAPGDRRNLTQEFQAELSAFTNYLLAIPDEVVTKTLLGNHQIAELNTEFWAGRQRTDSIAAWFNDCVIHDPMALTPVGGDRFEGKDGNTPVTLFGSYCLHSQRSGTQAKSSKNFSPELLELCNNVLKLPIEKVALRTGKFIKGLRLRISGVDDHIPSYEIQLEEVVSNQSSMPPPLICDGLGDGLVADSVAAETVAIQGCDGSDRLNLLLNEDKINQEKPKNDFFDIDPKINDLGEEVGNTLSVTSVTIEIEQGVNPSRDVSPDPSLEPSQELLVAKVDFSTFPHLTSDDYRAKEKRATQIKLEMLACGTCEALAQFQAESGYGEFQIAWVIQNGLNPTEKVQLQMIQQLSQPCLDLSIASSVSEVSPSVESVSSEVVEASAYQWDEIERETNLCMEQLGWTLEQGRSYLQACYGVSSRHRLSDEQLLEFLAYLKGEVARRNL